MVVLVPGLWEGSGRGAASVDKKRRGTRGEEVKLALGRRARQGRHLWRWFLGLGKARARVERDCEI